MKAKIGIVGCGAISGIYLKNLSQMFDNTEVIGVCDLIDERAEKAVKEYKILRKYKDMHELFADPAVDIVLNLTRPYEHFDVNMAAIAAGKHVYTEKPLGATLEEGKKNPHRRRRKGRSSGWCAGYIYGSRNPNL
jgi:predicted dehydrogenase